MKPQNETSASHAATIRAGVISLLIPSLYYLWTTGLGNLPLMGMFIVSFAICFVLMMQSVVDLLVLTLSYAAKFSGMALGRLTRTVRYIFPQTPHTL